MPEYPAGRKPIRPNAESGGSARSGWASVRTTLGQWLVPSACFLAGAVAVTLIGSKGNGPQEAPAPPPRSLQVEDHVARARDHLSSQRLVEAFAEAKQAEALAPRDAGVQSHLGDVAHASGSKDAEERYYRRAIELDANYAPARANLALVLIDLGQTREALEQARIALASADPQDPRYRALLGHCLLSQGRPKDAVTLLQIGVDHGLYYAEKSLGRALDLSGQGESALRVFDNALQRDPTDPQTYFWRADCLRRLGREQEAQDALVAQKKHLALEVRILRIRDELLIHDPDNAGLLIELARAFWEQGSTRDALATLERAEKLAPGNADALSLRRAMSSHLPASPK
jgi:tetratricopeptide (TPR) repeat protein